MYLFINPKLSSDLNCVSTFHFSQGFLVILNLIASCSKVIITCSKMVIWGKEWTVMKDWMGPITLIKRQKPQKPIVPSALTFLTRHQGNYMRRKSATNVVIPDCGEAHEACKFLGFQMLLLLQYYIGPRLLNKRDISALLFYIRN